MNLSLPWILAMTAPPPDGGGQSNFLLQLAPIALIFALFYFLMIAPARKKQKKHAEMLGALKPGDKVVTNGGIYGTVAGVTDHVVQLKIAEQVKIEVAKQSIAGMRSEG